jgi:hypothetical protein
LRFFATEDTEVHREKQKQKEKREKRKPPLADAGFISVGMAHPTVYKWK